MQLANALCSSSKLGQRSLTKSPGPPSTVPQTSSCRNSFHTPCNTYPSPPLTFDPCPPGGLPSQDLQKNSNFEWTLAWATAKSIFEPPPCLPFTPSNTPTPCAYIWGSAMRSPSSLYVSPCVQPVEGQGNETLCVSGNRSMSENAPFLGRVPMGANGGSSVGD